MVFKDFRDYLDSLDKHGMLVRVTKEVSPNFEIAAAIRKVSDTNGPALLFENVSGYPGWRVVGGLFATRRLMAFALQTEENNDKLMQRYLESDQQRIKPILVSSGPVKEIIIKGDDVDLTKLPFPTYCEEDEGPYSNAGVQIAKNAATGVQNVSTHRMAILGKDKVGLYTTQVGHLRLMIQAAEEQGQGLGIAVVTGAHPALIIASSVKAPMGVDEVEIAGALRGKPFEMVKCETIDVSVPANAEVVIEGVAVPGERVIQGTWGTEKGNYILLPGQYTVTSNGKLTIEGCVVKVNAITMRKNAILQALLTGMPQTEDQNLATWSLTSAIYRVVTRIVPSPQDLRGVYLTPGSACSHVVISIHKRAEPTSREIIHTILGMMGAIIQRVVVVDEDINIYDPAEVEWATATRVISDRDIVVLPSATAQPPTIRWGIDATVPLSVESWKYKKAVPPGVSKVDYI